MTGRTNLPLPPRPFFIKRVSSDEVAPTSRGPPANSPPHRGRLAPLRSMSEKKKHLEKGRKQKSIIKEYYIVHLKLI